LKATMNDKINMRKKVAELGLNCLFILFFSYVFNFVWESFHAVSLYEKHDFGAPRYVPMVSYVAIIDSFLILGIYFITAACWRNLFWLRKMNKKHILFTIIAGTTIAAIIEYERVFISEVWSYNAHMPTLFGIGLSPLLQLSVTGLITFSLTRAILYQRGIYSERISKNDFYTFIC
jgi:hypothetical protein